MTLQPGLQVINVDNSTASPSVLLVLDNKRYLFNAGEGIQRHFIENKQKMRQVGSSSSRGDACADSHAYVSQ
jgi:ribonuclease BN (tRNA processing enzyme)